MLQLHKKRHDEQLLSIFQLRMNEESLGGVSLF